MEGQTKNQAHNTVDNHGDELKKTIFIYLVNWRWFLLSVVLCLLFGYLKVKQTIPTYTRSASIMMKDDKKSGHFFGEINESFSNIGLSGGSYNVLNEMNALQSPIIIEEVVRRLGFDMSYAAKGRSRLHPLYGITNPVKVEFLDIPNDRPAAMTMRLYEDGKYKIVRLSSKDESYKDEIEGVCGDTLDTPVGRILVSRSSSVANWDGEIVVSRTSVKNAARGCSGRLGVALADKNATIVDITYSDASIQRADDFINTLIEVYNEKWLQDKNQVAVSTSAFINDRLAYIEAELGVVDKDISSYKSANLITDVQSVSNMYMSQATQAEATQVQLNNEIYMAKYIRDYLLDGEGFKIIPAVSGFSDATVSMQITKFNDLLLERNKVLANSSENSPVVQEKDATLKIMKSAIISSIDNEVKLLEQRILSQQRYGSKATSQIASSPEHTLHLLDVSRQQKVKEAIYMFLLQKREENELSQAFTAYNTRLICPPSGSDAPSSPKTMQILLIALAIGLAIPFAVIYVLNLLDTKIKTREDIEDKMTMPYLGEIPLAVGKEGRKSKMPSLRRYVHKVKTGKEICQYAIVKSGSRSLTNEAFRVLRTNIEFMTNGGSGNSAIITSYNVGSGKSFVSNNIARSFAINGKKVLVIDCDIRKASLSKFYGNPSKGICNYLAGQVDDIDSLIFTVEDIPTLDVLPVGVIPPNPSELVSSERFANLVAKMKTRYDYVFMDCPPVDIVADTSIIQKQADRTFFMIRAGLFEKSHLVGLEQEYLSGKFVNPAIILNGTDAVFAGRYSSGRYGYGRYGYGRYGYGRYGYGYGYGYGSNKNDYITED